MYLILVTPYGLPSIFLVTNADDRVPTIWFERALEFFTALTAFFAAFQNGLERCDSKVHGYSADMPAPSS